MEWASVVSVNHALEWIGPRVTGSGVVERAFVFHGVSSRVPGLLWEPAASARATPLVLLGHGGSGHKGAARIVRLARWFAAEAGFAAVAIDGPFHGDCAPSQPDSPGYQLLMADEGVENVVTRMVDEWCGVIQVIADGNPIDGDRLGYGGLSMGTRFGLPLAAELGPRLWCAVLGKFGLQQGRSLHHTLDAPELIGKAAPRVSVPLMFHLQRDDEVFARAGQIELFDLIASRDKRLVERSGGHRMSRPSDEIEWREFIAAHL